MPRGECMPAFLVWRPPRALRPQDGPGCATPADGDPYRNRTCVRCLRGSRPTARRTGRELVRKVEVSNPHGRTVSLFSNRVPPANEAYLPGRSGSGSNAGEVALGLRLASEHLPTRSTLQMHRVDSSSPDSAPGSIRTSILRLRRPLRVQSRHGGNEDRNDLGPRATTRTRPEDLSRTKAALFPLSYGGVASSTGLEPVPLPSEGSALVLLSYDEMAPRPGLEPGTGDS